MSLQRQGLAEKGIPVPQLSNASDEELTNVLLNRSVTTTEDQLFVTRQQTLSFQLLKAIGWAKPRNQSTAAASRQQTLPSQTLTLPDSLFLTGFTFAKDFEWSKQASVTIDWCWVGCSETHVEFEGRPLPGP